MVKTLKITAFGIGLSLVSFAQNLPSIPDPATIPISADQMKLEADKFKKEGLPTQAEASNSAAPSVAKPQAMALLSMLTTKLGLSDVQKSKMESVISKLDMENITSPKAQVKSLLSKSLPELSGFLKPNQLDTLKGLAESAKKGKK